MKRLPMGSYTLSMIWITKKSKNFGSFEYFIAATPNDVATAVREFENTGYCDCSLIETIIEKSHDYRVCAVCGRKLNEL